MRVSAIIEARMGSSRLPGKTMLPVNGSPLLDWMCARVWQATLIDTIVVATPDKKDNKPIWEWAEKRGGPQLKFVTGSENDVLGRVLKAAKETDTDVIVELTADCPLVDPSIIDMCAGYFICGDWDFVGNVSPRTWPQGMDVRVFKTSTLARIDEEVKGHPQEKYWREHVSPYIYQKGTGYDILNLDADGQSHYPELNLSVDTYEDFRRVKNVIEGLAVEGQPFTANVRQMLEYLATLPGYEFLSKANPRSKEASWLQSLSPEAQGPLVVPSSKL